MAERVDEHVVPLPEFLRVGRDILGSRRLVDQQVLELQLGVVALQSVERMGLAPQALVHLDDIGLLHIELMRDLRTVSGAKGPSPMSLSSAAIRLRLKNSFFCGALVPMRTMETHRIT